MGHLFPYISLLTPLFPEKVEIFHCLSPELKPASFRKPIFLNLLTAESNKRVELEQIHTSVLNTLNLKYTWEISRNILQFI